MTDPLTASLTLARPDGGRGVGRVGADRIALLRAIRDTGSLSAAARVTGLSYKGAWDAVRALNNLFDQPLVIATAGGSAGGASIVSAAGEAVIAAFTAVEAELAGAVARLEAALATATEPNGAGASARPLLWGLAMRTSARNVLHGHVAAIAAGQVAAEVTLRIAEGVDIVATVTRDSVAALDLHPGTPALALIKSSFVILARDDGPLRTSARNCLAGVVIDRQDGEVGSEVTLELHLGKTLTATLTRDSADALDLVPGTPALALVKASHVILMRD